MVELLTQIAIVVMYLGTMMGMVCFLAFVCRVGDLGFMLLGWLDNKIQQRAVRVPVKNER